MDPPEPSPFLEVSRLVEASLPRARVSMLWWVGGLFLVLVMSTALTAGQPASVRTAVQLLCFVGMAGLIFGMSALSVYTVRRFRGEQRQVEQIGELVQLRRWPEAAMALEQYLSQPARSHAFRVQALAYLASVLTRLHRFEDAIAVQNRLLDEGMLDPSAAAMMRVGRAMAMLREDHLFDADRAINELRRGPAAGSAGVALVEIYRDVKTGHPADAVAMFEQQLPVLRDHLGHRVADAYALAARAYDLLGQEAQAREAFRKATVLAPPGELFRRYPEVQKLAGRFVPATAPPEAV